jgi:hypothetical protein
MRDDISSIEDYRHADDEAKEDVSEEADTTPGHEARLEAEETKRDVAPSRAQRSRPQALCRVER